MSDLIRVAIFAPALPVTVELVANDLEHMQQVVGGYIEMLQITDDRLFLICNEEGKIDGLPANRGLSGSGGYDILVGTFFVCRCDEEGEMTSILSEDEELLKAWTPQRTWDITTGCAMLNNSSPVRLR